MRASWRLWVVIALGGFFLGSLYLGFSLQREEQVSELASELFIEQLNAGAFVALSQQGERVQGRSASGDYFVAVVPSRADLATSLIAAGADAELVNDILAREPARPLGERLASQLLWLGPVVLFVGLLLIVWRGQKLPAER